MAEPLLSGGLSRRPSGRARQRGPPETFQQAALPGEWAPHTQFSGLESSRSQRQGKGYRPPSQLSDRQRQDFARGKYFKYFLIDDLTLHRSTLLYISEDRCYLYLYMWSKQWLTKQILGHVKVAPSVYAVNKQQQQDMSQLL